MSDLLFCNASKRVEHCMRRTNICCLKCDVYSECLILSKEAKSTRPCSVADFDEDETCEFLI